MSLWWKPNNMILVHSSKRKTIAQISQFFYQTSMKLKGELLRSSASMIYPWGEKKRYPHHISWRISENSEKSNVMNIKFKNLLDYTSTFIYSQYNHNTIINYQMMHLILQTWPSNVCFASKTCFICHLFVQLLLYSPELWKSNLWETQLLFGCFQTGKRWELNGSVCSPFRHHHIVFVSVDIEKDRFTID